MKKTILIVVATVICAALQPTQAQTRFGVQAGVNLSSITDMKTHVGFHAGVTTEIPILWGLQFNPGVLYSMKGTSDDVTVLGATAKTDITTHHISVPLFFSYKLNLTGSLVIAPHVGPYIGYGLGGSAKTTLNNKEISNTDVYGDAAASLKANAFECGMGIGVNVQCGNIQVGAGYDLPFTNFTDEVTAAGIKVADATKMSNVRISLTYLF